MASALTVTPEEFKEKLNMLLDYRRKLGLVAESFKNSLVTVFGYIDDDQERVRDAAANVSSPLVERSREGLEKSLLFGSREQCYQRIKAFYEAGVQSVCLWPIKSYINQIELFTRDRPLHLEQTMMGPAQLV